MRMIVARMNGAVLTYDTDDVEDLQLSTPVDMVETLASGGTAVHRESGQHHLTLHVDFRPGARPIWIKEEELNHG